MNRVLFRTRPRLCIAIAVMYRRRASGTLRSVISNIIFTTKLTLALTLSLTLTPTLNLTLQEGQHPLTRQRAANFRLLANQWAERRLVMQWSHRCCAMRRSVCNAGASNEVRSLCVQMSRERSYPLSICWYHSKGNWLRYNFAADSFYMIKLCSSLFVLYCRNRPKDDKFI